MPTDLDAARVTAQKREAQAQRETVFTVMLVCLIISLGVLLLMLEVVGQQ
jgi:hypothetical protein